jgi:hypothetical protein
MKLTMSDVKIWNKRAGQHFFDRATMKFFESRIESTLMKGNYFITSEKPPHNPRHYKVRQYNPNNHHIISISEELSYDGAKQLIKDLQKGIV